MEHPKRFLGIVVSVWIAAFAAASDMQGSTPQCHATPTSAASDKSSPAPQVEQTQKPDEKWPSQVNVPIIERDRILSDGEHEKTVLFKNIRIKGIYKSMRGPWARKYVDLDPAHQGRYLWITRYRAEVLDGQTGQASQEFICHTNMGPVTAAGRPGAFQNLRTDFSISQGEKEVAFPKGFALRVDNTPEQQTDVNVMVLNNNYPEMDKPLDFKATIDYVDAPAATARKLIPLFEGGVSVDCPTIASPLNQGDPVCQTATAYMVSSGGDKRTGHWLVPPGRQVMSTKMHGLYLPYDTTVHHIEMHVHPYAESMELRDLTSGHTIWKGKVQNDSHLAIIRSTEHYSSVEGLPVYKDHDYQLIAIYNNPSDRPIDAMASLWMYFRDKT